MTIAARTEALFRGSGALMDGHFCSRAAAWRPLPGEVPGAPVPRRGRGAVRLHGGTRRDADGSPAVDVVVGPTTGGVLLAFEVARQLGVRGIFAEEVQRTDGAAHREFRRGFTIAPGERVLLVDDILTTGGSLLAMLPAIEVDRRRPRASPWSSPTVPAASARSPRRRPAAPTPRTRSGRWTCRPGSPGPGPPAPRAPTGSPASAHPAPTGTQARAEPPGDPVSLPPAPPPPTAPARRGYLIGASDALDLGRDVAPGYR